MMDDMQDDEIRAAIAATIKGAEDFREANRYPADHAMLCVLPDWLDAKLTGQDREDLLNHHVTVRSHTEVHGEGQ